MDDFLIALKASDPDLSRAALVRIDAPLLRKGLLWRFYRQPGMPVPFKELTDFITANPNWPAQSLLRRRAEGLSVSTKPIVSILPWFDKNTPRTAVGCVGYVRALIKAERAEEAKTEAARCWSTLKFSRSLAARFLADFGEILSAEAQEQRIRGLLRRRRGAQALALAEKIKLPKAMVDQIKLRIKLQSKPKRKSRTAILKALSRSGPQYRKDPDFLFDEIRWHRRRRAYDQAAKGLKAAPSDEENPRRWWRERSIVIHHYLKIRKYRAAYSVAAGHKQKSQPVSSGFIGAEALAGWIAFRRLKKAAEARLHFTRIYTHARDIRARSRSTYWLGRIAEQAKHKTISEGWYRLAAKAPWTFYGQLAVMRLPGRTLTLPAATKILPDAKKRLEATPLFRLISLFSQVNDANGARQLIFHLTRVPVRNSDDLYLRLLAAEQAKIMGLPIFSVRGARFAFRHNGFAWDSAYPTVATEAKLPVEPAFIFAIIRQESEFNVAARSGKNALGLMQLLPTTAKRMARRAKVKFNQKRLTRDGAFNILLGSHYLDLLLRRFGRSMAVTAASYNAGLGRVGKWLNIYGDPRRRSVDLIDWIEQIPFGETRNYVRRVLANVTIYRARAGNNHLAATPSEQWNAKKLPRVRSRVRSRKKSARPSPKRAPEGAKRSQPRKP